GLGARIVLVRDRAELPGLQGAVLDLVEPGADRLELALDEGRLGGVEIELRACVLHATANVSGKSHGDSPDREGLGRSLSGRPGEVVLGAVEGRRRGPETPRRLVI